jgi:hypothetical protein
VDLLERSQVLTEHIPSGPSYYVADDDGFHPILSFSSLFGRR